MTVMGGAPEGSIAMQIISCFLIGFFFLLEPTGCAATISRYFSSTLQSRPHWLESPRIDLQYEENVDDNYDVNYDDNDDDRNLFELPSCFLDRLSAPAGSLTGLAGRLGNIRPA